MTAFDTHTADLHKALLAVCRWERRKERDDVLRDTMRFIAKQLGYELVEKIE